MANTTQPVVISGEQPKETEEINSFNGKIIEEENQNSGEQKSQEENEDDDIIEIEPVVENTVALSNWKQLPGKIVIKVVVWFKERIQQTIDLSIRFFLSPTKKVVAFIQKPVIKKIAIGVTSIALFGVCGYAFGYIPYQYIKQSKSLSFH